MLNTQLSPWPSFSEEEISAVSQVLQSNKVNYWTGQQGRDFEKEFASYTDSQYAIALANGTLALDLALHALDIGCGDEVIVTSRTFIASISSIINAGATPVFADVELTSQNISASTIKTVLTKKTKAIICVHLAGWPCEMDDIMALAKTENLFVIEDCAQAHGTKYKGRSVGSIGHIGAWSFCQDKIMTTGGEGGMLTTNDESFGTNWRLTEMQSAIGRIQLKRMANWTKLRNENAEKIFQICRRYPWLVVPTVPDYIVHAYYKCYVFIDIEKLPTAISRDEIIDIIHQHNIPCYSGSCSEVYKEKAFDKTNLRPKVELKNAQTLGNTSLMFLVHPTLTHNDMNTVCQALSQAFDIVDNKR